MKWDNLLPVALTRRLSVAGLCALLAGCGSSGEVFSDRTADYKRQQVAQESLEVPPDLTRGSIGDAMPVPGTTPTGSASLTEYEQQRRTGGNPLQATGREVLPEMDNVRVMRDGDQRWLAIDAPPDQVWPRLVAFWRQSGVLLLEQDPTVGVMKTDWLENRADIKEGFLTDLFRKALDSIHSAATRDQFRVRLEPGERPGTTDLFLTHRGMREELTRDTTGDTQNSFWVPRPNDPGLEAEMLRRIMVYLGVTEKRADRALAESEARTAPRAQMVADQEQGPSLMVDAQFAPAWRLVGVAVERVGFAVEDRDRSAGIYYVRYDDPDREEDEGFLSSLAFWRDKPKFDREILYRIKLDEQGEVTRVHVQDKDGKPELSDTATRILTLIQEQIR